MTERLLVIEDDAGIREGLVDALTHRGYLVAAAATAGAATQELQRGRFSLVVLDLALPDGDGVDVLRALRRGGDTTPVIVLTARASEEHRVRGLRAGADDYVVKPFSIAELDARIQAVLRRAAPAAATTRLGDATVDLAGLLVEHAGTRHRLVAKEAELLAFLLRHPGRAFRREDLLSQVWGYDIDAQPTTRTVDTHVFNLRRKLERDPEAPRHLLTVHGVGYKLVT